jgi:hypothetical protein
VTFFYAAGSTVTILLWIIYVVSGGGHVNDDPDTDESLDSYARNIAELARRPTTVHRCILCGVQLFP